MREPVEKKTSNAALWVDQHGDALYRFALLRVKDIHVAEDLVQDTFLSALQAIGEFKGASSPRTWLIGILKHKIFDHFRRKSMEIGSALAEVEELDQELFDERGRWKNPPAEWKLSPESLMENKEFWKIFMGCLDALPRALGRAFSLREIDDLPGEEICKILKISTTNLWVMLHRARSRLRRCLEQKWFLEKP